MSSTRKGVAKSPTTRSTSSLWWLFRRILAAPLASALNSVVCLRTMRFDVTHSLSAWWRYPENLLDGANPASPTKMFQLRAPLSVGDLREVLVAALPQMDVVLRIGIISHDGGPDAVRRAIVADVS